MRGSEDGSGGVLESLEPHHGLWAVQYVPEIRHCSVCVVAVWRVVPVRMFWKASSTLLASKADVSMKDRLFSPG